MALRSKAPALFGDAGEQNWLRRFAEQNGLASDYRALLFGLNSAAEIERALRRKILKRANIFTLH